MTPAQQALLANLSNQMSTHGATLQQLQFAFRWIEQQQARLREHAIFAPHTDLAPLLQSIDERLVGVASDLERLVEYMSSIENVVDEVLVEEGYVDEDDDPDPDPPRVASASRVR